MLRREVLVAFNTKSDGDEGYGESIDLKLLADILRFQTTKYENTDIRPMIQLVGDSLQIYKEVYCTEEEFYEAEDREVARRERSLIQQAMDLGYKLQHI